MLPGTRPPLLSSVLIHYTSHRRAQGTYLGTLEGVNHLDLVGWINTARYKWAEIMGREIKFKPATFYLGIADHLARVVEGQGHPEDSEVGAGAVVDARPGTARESSESSGERMDRERGEMAESLQKGEEVDSQRRTSTSETTGSSTTPIAGGGDGRTAA